MIIISKKKAPYISYFVCVKFIVHGKGVSAEHGRGGGEDGERPFSKSERIRVDDTIPSLPPDGNISSTTITVGTHTGSQRKDVLL